MFNLIFRTCIGRCLALVAVPLAIIFISSFASAGEKKFDLHSGWTIQDSKSAQANGSEISRPLFSTASWHPASVPSTILGALVSTGSYGDFFFGRNLLQLPGSGDYFLNPHFLDKITPASSPFGRAWWYRTEFIVPKDFKNRQVDLHLDGITYGAEIWLNGQRIASKSETEGMYRHFNFEVTATLLNRRKNVLAILVSPPTPDDLTATWFDWCPTPQDKNMGLWREVYLSHHGTIEIKNPQVITELDLPERKIAHLTVETELRNSNQQPVSGKLIGTITDQSESSRPAIQFSQDLTISAHTTVAVQMKPSQFPQLNIGHPALWWPKQMGKPQLHRLNLRFVTNDKLEQDALTTVFGIRKIESTLTLAGSRLFSVNGLPILIRGGGWSPDLLLRFNRGRLSKELNYVQDLGLNTIRLEGHFENQALLELSDQKGLLVMAGWMCCNAWQFGDSWNDKTYAVANESLRDQILELRQHPSVFVFLYGSDEPPPDAIEKMYVETFKQFHWANPILSSANSYSTPMGGKTGVKMNGPYDYVPPRYWTIDTKHGGAFGFNTETSPGPAVPPIESLKEMISPEHLWPIDDEWNFHSGRRHYSDIHIFTDALKKRYGEAHSAEEFAMKSQVMAYDGHRAMFEAFGKNKYHPATGVIQWMLNNPWPSLIWHLYDYYLRPGGSYFGVKKANEPVHIQYSYDDQSIVIVNSTYHDVQDLQAHITVLDPALHVLESANLKAAVSADSTQIVYKVHEPKLAGKLYFVKLWLESASKVRVSDNFYWLSTDKEVFKWGSTNSRTTPVSSDADLTELNSLKPVTLDVSSKVSVASRSGTVTLKNSSQTLAFFSHARLVQRIGDRVQEILPILWEDNYVSLLPGETRVLHVDFAQAKVGHAPIEVRLDGYNVRAN